MAPFQKNSVERSHPTWTARDGVMDERQPRHDACGRATSTGAVWGHLTNGTHKRRLTDLKFILLNLYYSIPSTKQKIELLYPSNQTALIRTTPSRKIKMKPLHPTRFPTKPTQSPQQHPCSPGLPDVCLAQLQPHPVPSLLCRREGAFIH